MKLCPTCGEVYPDQSTECRAHNIVLHDWVDATDTHTSSPTVVDDHGRAALDAAHMMRVGELTEPELHLGAATPPNTNIAIDPSLFIQSEKPCRVLGGRYRLGEHIGIGGYGAVFDAYDERLDKRVAVKILSPAVTQDAEVVARFEREAIAASRVRHECIVDVTDFDVDPAGTSFIVMEYLDGSDLSDVIDDDGPLEPARALAIAAQCASALTAAHASGILHRDLKPANIFLVSSPSRSDFVKIIDFGISKITNADGHYSNVTSASKVVGTPFYMPPEQARGQKLDGRTDVYALGIILFEMLTDERPFIGASALEILTNAMNNPRVAPSTRRPELGDIAGIDDLVLGAISVDRNKRFDSMEAFGEAIMACLSNLDATLTLGLPAIAYSSEAKEAGRVGSKTRPPTDVDPVKPATLEASSGEVTAQHRAGTGRRWVVPALGAALAIAALIALWLSNRADDPGESPKPSARPAHTPVVVTEPPPRPIRELAEPTKLDSDTPSIEIDEPSSERSSHTVRLTSSPSGAVVSKRGLGRLGVTPLDVTLSAGEDASELSLELAGHVGTTVSIDRDSDTALHVQLAASRPAPPRAKPPRAKPPRAKPPRAKLPTAEPPPAKPPTKPSIGIKDW